VFCLDIHLFCIRAFWVFSVQNVLIEWLALLLFLVNSVEFCNVAGSPYLFTAVFSVAHLIEINTFEFLPSLSTKEIIIEGALPVHRNYLCSP
jgi:hypothetical protein